MTIVPFENVSGARQISSLVTFNGEIYVSYYFVDNPKNYLGPVDVRRAEAQSNDIRNWLDSQKGNYEAVVPVGVRLVEASFFLNTEIATVIEGIDITGRDGKELRMRREGAAYPYGLVLEVTLTGERCQPNVAG